MPPEAKTKTAAKPKAKKAAKPELSASAKDEAVELLKEYAYSRWSDLMNRNGLTDRG
jgi:hypothetical protein